MRAIFIIIALSLALRWFITEAPDEAAVRTVITTLVLAIVYAILRGIMKLASNIGRRF